MNKTQQSSARGFTLIEMLIVMGIIAVLAGILLPVVVSARETARRSHCLNNLSQVQKAVLVYANSFSEYFPALHCWGQTSAAYSIGHGDSLTNYAGHQGLSRNMVIGYGAEVADPMMELGLNNMNFVPVGLGILVGRGDLGAGILGCPSAMGAKTYYGSAEYEYDRTALNSISGSEKKPLVTSDGRYMFHTETEPGKSVTAVLSSFSYRNHPFYSRLAPDGAKNWTNTNDNSLKGAKWTLPLTRPAVQAEFMCPPFKTVKLLAGRALMADSFDFEPESAGGKAKQGFVTNHHRGGYNVSYGDGHCAWYDDENTLIGRWSEWADPANPATDNLTISSISSERAWNVFDQAAGIDVQAK